MITLIISLENNFAPLFFLFTDKIGDKCTEGGDLIVKAYCWIFHLLNGKNKDIETERTIGEIMWSFTQAEKKKRIWAEYVCKLIKKNKKQRHDREMMRRWIQMEVRTRLNFLSTSWWGGANRNSFRLDSLHISSSPWMLRNFS